MKKIIANLLVFALAVNMLLFTVYGKEETIPVAATGTTQFNGMQYYEWGGAQAEGEKIVNLRKTGSYATYKLNVANAGVYNIQAKVLTYHNPTDSVIPPALSIDVNGFREYDNINLESTLSNWAWPTVDLGNVNFMSGTNILKFTATENVYIANIKITYVSDETNTDVITIDAATATIYGSSNGSPAEPMTDGASVWFGVDIPEDGYYALTTSSYAATDASNYEVYKNSISEANRVFDGHIDIDYTGAMIKTAPTLLNISQDTTTLILVNNGEGNKLYGIRLEKIMSASAANAFMSGLSSASGPDSLRELMSTNSYFKNNTSKISHSRWLYERLYEKKNASTLNEFFQVWSDVLPKVEASPDVTLWNNGVQVTKPGRGLNTVKVNLGVSRGTKVIAAMYDGNNKLIDYVVKDSSNKEQELAFKVPVENENAVCKVFFWDDFEHLRPMTFLDMYNIYVSPDGKDTNSGSKAEPFKTIQKAKEYAADISAYMKEDIVVNILPGEYFLDEKIVFDENDGGKNGNNIIFRGIGTTKPLISGGVKVGNNKVATAEIPHESYNEWNMSSMDAAEITLNEGVNKLKFEVSAGNILYIDTFTLEKTDGLPDMPLEVPTITVDGLNYVGGTAGATDVTGAVKLYSNQYVEYNIEVPVAGKYKLNITFRNMPYRSTETLDPLNIYVGKSWTDDNGDGIWQINVPEISEARQMYINGFAAERAKSDKLYTPDETLYSDGDGTYTYDGFVTTSYDFPDFAHPEEMEVVANIKWAMFRMPIEDITYRSATKDTLFEMKQPYYNSNITLPRGVTGVLPITGYRFYLENAIELLDKEGEFYFDKRTHTLYYKPVSGQNLSTAEVYLPKTEGIMDIIGTTANKVSNIRFENLDFRHGAFNDATARGASFVQSDCRVDPTRANQSWASAGLTNKSQIHIENAKNIAITDCNISNLGSVGIGLVDNVSDSEIKRNTIHDISATSILVGHWRSANLSADTICNNITIENNIITRTGQEFMGSSAMAVYYAKNVKILHNEISDTPYTGLTVGWGWGATAGQAYGSGNHKIMYNKISSTSKMMRDGGDIYTLGYLAGTEISNNYLIGNNDMASIYLDNGTANVTVSNNVCKDRTDYSRGWLYVNSGATNNVASNNYVDADKYQVSSSATNISVSGTTTFADDNFTGDALSVINNAGIESGINLSVPARPSDLKTVYDYVPQTEQVESGDILIEAESTESYQYINGFPTDSDRGRKAAILGNQNTNYARYKISVPKAGKYRLEVRMYAAQESTDQTEDFTLKVKHGRYTFLLNNEAQTTKPVNYITYGLYHSCYVADLDLGKNSSYYIQLENLSDKVINIDNFKLIYLD